MFFSFSLSCTNHSCVFKSKISCIFTILNSDLANKISSIHYLPSIYPIISTGVTVLIIIPDNTAKQHLHHVNWNLAKMELLARMLTRLTIVVTVQQVYLLSPSSLFLFLRFSSPPSLFLILLNYNAVCLRS